MLYLIFDTWVIENEYLKYTIDFILETIFLSRQVLFQLKTNELKIDFNFSWFYIVIS